MTADLEILKNMFNANSQMFQAVANGVPEEKWLTRPAERSNHLTWIAGHVVIHRAKVSKMLGDTWSAPWEGLFARGGKLVDPAQYPTPAALRQAWTDVTAKLSTALDQLSPEISSKPVPHGTPSLNGTTGGSIGLLCFHETYHIGQMGFVKKMLGCGQTVG